MKHTKIIVLFVKVLTVMYTIIELYRLVATPTSAASALASVFVIGVSVWIFSDALKADKEIEAVEAKNDQA